MTGPAPRPSTEDQGETVCGHDGCPRKSCKCGNCICWVALGIRYDKPVPAPAPVATVGDEDAAALAEIVGLFADHDETVCGIGTDSPCRCKCGFVLPRCVRAERFKHRNALVADWPAALLAERVAQAEAKVVERIIGAIQARRDGYAELCTEPNAVAEEHVLHGYDDALDVARSAASR